jgi:hypothetical protein
MQNTGLKSRTDALMKAPKGQHFHFWNLLKDYVEPMSTDAFRAEVEQLTSEAECRNLISVGLTLIRQAIVYSQIEKLGGQA